MYRVVRHVKKTDNKLTYYCIEQRKRLLFLFPYWSKNIFRNFGLSRFCFATTKEDAQMIINTLTGK